MDLTTKLTPKLTIELLVAGWHRQLRRSFIPLFILCVVLLACAIVLAVIAHNLAVGISVFCLISVTILCGVHTLRNLKGISVSWSDDLVAPLQRLTQTVTLIASQKLELLPEERRTSFTASTQQKLLDVAREILDHQRFIDRVVDNMFEMMFLLNPDGIIITANKSACEATKYSQTELVGQHIRKLFPHAGTLVDYFLELEIQFTATGAVHDMEIHVQTCEGEILPFSINGVKIESPSGDLLGYTVIAKNLSETFKLISELNKSNFSLNRANSELAKRYDEIKKEIEEKEGERKVLQLELATSQLVQRTFLPQTPPEHAMIEVAGMSVPAAFCGGDWWNTIDFDNKFLMLIGDVTGHGTASAMVTAAVSGYYVFLKQTLLGGARPSVSEILKGFDSVLSTMSDGNISYNMTFFVALFDFNLRTLTFANAGHNFPLLTRPGKKVEPLVAAGHRLGNIEKEVFQEVEIPIEPGDSLFFYTDGLIENQGSNTEPFGKRRLRKFLDDAQSVSCQELVDRLFEQSTTYYGATKELEDDVTFVAVKLKAF